MIQVLEKYLLNIHPISAEARKEISSISTLIKVKKNQDLQAIGKTCKTIYFLNKGLARIYYFKDGTDITDSFVSEGKIVARVESLFTNEPSTKGIQALEDCEFVSIDAGKLFELYDRFHEIERLFRKVFELYHIETVKRIESIQFHSAEERYLNMINEFPEIIKRAPLKYIASFLGITQVSLSRIRASI